MSITIDHSTTSVPTGASFGRGTVPAGIEFTGQTFVAADDFLNFVTFYIGNHGSQSMVLDYRLLVTTVASDANGFHPGTVLFESAPIRAPQTPAGPLQEVTVNTGNLQLVEGQTYAFILDALSGSGAVEGFVLGMSYWVPDGGDNYTGGYMVAANVPTTSTRAQAFASDWGDYNGTEAGLPGADLRFKLGFSASTAPTGMNLSPKAVSENKASGSIVGVLSATDAETPNGLTYQLLDSAGGRFSLLGKNIVVANGLKLDFEQSTSHLIKVRVADPGGLSQTTTFTISVLNLTPETVTGDAEANTIFGGIGADKLNGVGGNDTLVGGGGNDTLTGGLGSDLLRGDAGNDVYVLENGADFVADSAGIDMVTSTITRSLLGSYFQVENLRLLEFSTALNGTGNNLANVINGNKFSNTLSGGIGNDVLRGLGASDILIGGQGIDTLIGGTQSDFFVFNAPLSAAHRDVIADFSSVSGNNDTFRLENAVMPQLGAPGGLGPSRFFAGAAAHDADDRIVYNNATGALFFDANGNAAGGVTQLATLSNKVTLTPADFVVI
jgi:Ca2+-binding RTX toxin-like protein